MWLRTSVVLAAFAVSGMSCPDQILPLEPMYLNSGGPFVENIKVVNGAGKTLYDGSRPSNGQITANPTADELDGKLTITRTYSDGSTRQQTLTYEAGKPVNIGYRGASNDYYIKPAVNPTTTAQFYGGLTPSYEFLNRPNTNIVRLDQGGQLAGFVKADNESNNPAFNGRVGFRVDNPLFGLGRDWGFQITGNYYSSTAKEDRDVVPAGTGSTAIFGPVGGGGFNFGNNDITNLRYNSDYTSWESYLWFFKDYDDDVWDEVVDIHSYFGIDIGKNEDDQTLTGDVPGLALNFNSGNWIDNWFYGPVAGIETAWEVVPKVQVTTGMFGKLLFNDLSAKRMIMLSTGQTGADELNNSEWTVGGGASFGVNYEISPAINFKAGYTFEYANNTPVINIDRNTGDATVNAEGADKHEVYLGLVIDY